MPVDQIGDLYRRDLNKIASPIPRNLFAKLTDDELADNIQRLYTARRAQMSTRILTDMRLLRWMDPERLQDQWQNFWTGKPLSKLYHSAGLSVEIFNWSKPVVEALTGLLAGYKPFAYDIDVEPEDPAADSDLLQADIIEKLLSRRREKMNYRITYMDHVANIVALGRGAKYCYWNDRANEPVVENLWPGNVAAFWQANRRTIEQVVVSRELTIGEAIDEYPDFEEAILSSVIPADAAYSSSNSQDYAKSQYSHVVLLTLWARMPDDKIGMAAALAGDQSGRSERGTLLLAKEWDTNYEDIPVRITPRFKIHDKAPDEATGALQDVAPLNTEYNEVASAFRDMLWRAIYQRYKAKGFTFRNAPRLIPGTGIYALPRPDQDIERIEEIVNTVPIEQFLNHLEEMIIVFPGLNRFFLGSAPPSETSGEAITAAINSSITRLEPIRTNIGEDELWMHRMLLGYDEKFSHFEHEGYTVSMSDIIEGKRNVTLQWADITPREATKEKQLALAGRAAGVISDDTAMGSWNILSKADEKRKIRKERADPIMHPEHVSQTASALIQMARAKAEQKAGAGGAGQAPPQVRVSLTGQMSPVGVQAAEAMIGIKDTGGGAPAPAPGGAAAVGNEAARTAAAQSAGAGNESQNSPSTAAPTGGSAAATVAPAPPGQTPGSGGA